MGKFDFTSINSNTDAVSLVLPSEQKLAPSPEAIDNEKT
jgi:hypothetical protein